MRSLSLVFALAVVAGCDDPPGLTLDLVASDPRTTQVRLLISDDDCGNCAPLTTDQGAVTGTVHLLHDDGPRDAIEAVDGNGVAHVRLQASSMPGNAPASLVALGLDDNLQPTEMARMSLDPLPDRRYEQLELGPLVDAVHVWGSTKLAYSCVEIDDKADAGVAAELFVPATDRDCDGRLDDDDCAPLDFAVDSERGGDVDPNLATCGADDSAICVVGSHLECPIAGGMQACSTLPTDPQVCLPSSFCANSCDTLTPTGCGQSSSFWTCQIFVVNGQPCEVDGIALTQNCNALSVEKVDASGVRLDQFDSSAELFDLGNNKVAEVQVITNPLLSICDFQSFAFDHLDPTKIGDIGTSWLRVNVGASDEILPLFVTFEDAADELACGDPGAVSICQESANPADTILDCN